MESIKKYDYIVVGGGIIGLSVAYKLSLKYPLKSILVLEKEEELAMHQTGRNSGVIHSGIYYRPGSFKAKNCINGQEQLVSFAKSHSIKYELCGKLIVATNDDELEDLDNLYKNGINNGLADIKMLDSESSKQYEPNVNCVKSIFVPYTGIIDFRSVVEMLAKEFLSVNHLNKLEKSTRVNSITNNGTKKILKTSKGDFESDFTIFAAGLNSDELAKMDGLKIDMQIVGFRGDYYKLTKRGEDKVNGLIYPVPDLDMPFLGVHLTKMYDGSFEAGPNAVFSFKKEGYSRFSFSIKDTIRALTFKGLWKMIPSYWKIGFNEYRRAFSKKRFLNSLQKMLPSLKWDEIETGKTGVRAQALDINGNLIDDFIIKQTSNSMHILNAPSPAATACLAIADEVLDRISN